ncbi:MAG TPA: AMP-binding protein [Paracoccus solventivorans]|uniref:AMP-binding protein n=1 Tax=Paracoccus solventivorans TaxID=53463 RepID=UPI002C8B210C|nr:AMP-binding protein [Paracoccus solventivorans]HMM10272.1 AMP-binding protein [Paracoccus solventivorans]
MSIQGKITGWPVTDSGAPATLVAALAANAAQPGSRPGFRERDFGIWREWSWPQVLDEVLSIAAGLETLGLGPGRALTVVGDNRAAIYFTMLAANALRAFPSPVYPDVPVDEFKTFVRFGEPDIALAEDQEQVDKLLDLRGRIGRPSTIIYDDPRGLAGYAEPGLIALSEVAARGRARLAAEPGLAADLVARARPDDPAVLLYSSGTTGTPKGIPLLHSNIVGGIANAEAGGYFQRGETLFAYLPTAWVGDFVFSLGAGVLLQATINIPERAETALHDLREVAPTFYLAAPRAWDAMLTRIQVGMADSTPLKRRLYDWFIPRAIELERKRLKGYRPNALERLREAVGSFVMYGPLKDYLGLSRAERAFTGGEAMGEDTFLFFRALGIKLKQFYGQTETCALSAAQVEGSVRIDTVGRAMPGVEVRIDDTGEILIRSASVFHGYADNPEATAEALTPDGFLRTGDAGHIQDSGDLVVLGRVSELVETAQGQRFIPTFIENRLKFSPYIRNVAILGAGLEELTAIVCIDYEAAGHWAEQRSISYSSYAELSQKPEMLDLISGEIARVNELQPEGLKIRRFVNLHKDFDADDGEITRTRKLRRKVIEQTYAALVAALYDGSDEVIFDAKITYEDGREGTLRRNLVIRRV